MTLHHRHQRPARAMGFFFVDEAAIAALYPKFAAQRRASTSSLGGYPSSWGILPVLAPRSPTRTGR